jgi:predicted AAA+ superfamily ATPase
VLIHRSITANLLEALSDTPVVMMTGARQSGKSTLTNLDDAFGGNIDLSTPEEFSCVCRNKEQSTF